MQQSEIIEIIEKWAPLSAQSSWDASGVQAAARPKPVRKLAVMLDPSLEGIQRAAALEADFILSHHPLSMKPRFPNKADSYLDILGLLMGRGICLYSAHTSLDANPAGPARWLADELGLHNIELLEPAGPESSYGFGFVGDLPHALSYKDFRNCLGAALRRDAWRSCGPRPAQVSRIACLPGSGADAALAAQKAGANLLITGDVKYHAALDAVQAGMCILDVGHFCLEEEMMRRFALILERELSIPVEFIPGAEPFEPDGR